MPDASCKGDYLALDVKFRTFALARAAKPLKRVKTAMGSYWKKLAWIWVWRHSRLGSALHPLGLDATSAWGWLSSAQHREASGRRALSRNWPRLLPMLLSANFGRRRHGNDLR
jgi:hypothetical protein